MARRPGAFSAEFVAGKNCVIIDSFCRGLSVCSRKRNYWRTRKEYIAYCFASRNDAEFVQIHFGGEFVDPRNLRHWSTVNGHSTD